MTLTLNCDYFRTHRLVFVMKTDYVFCQAGTQSVYIIVMNLRNRRPCRGSGVQLQMPGLDPGPVDVKFVVVKVTLGQFLLPALHISPVSSNPPMLHIHLQLLVSEGQAWVNTCEIFGRKSENGTGFSPSTSNPLPLPSASFHLRSTLILVFNATLNTRANQRHADYPNDSDAQTCRCVHCHSITESSWIILKLQGCMLLRNVGT